ncbi:MAG: acetyltransferase [Alphaproteobacteria bacterium]|nr:acetyltransferase [Alphaproteobacteria bacterium]
MSDIIIVGAGGLGLEVASYAEDMRRASKSNSGIKGFLDDTKPVGTQHAGYPVLGPTDKIISECLYVIAVGAPESRQMLAEKLAAKGANFASIIHPSAHIAASAEIGVGTVIAPFVFVGPEARLGEQCLLNIYASAGHESRMENYCVLSPYATIHGASVLGSGAFMGSHACVTAKIQVGAGARIAAGSVVYQNIPAGARVMGNPAAWRNS